MFVRPLLVLATLCCLIESKSTPVTVEQKQWKVHTVSRTIDLSGALARISTTFNIESEETATDSGVFRLAIPDSLHGNLSWLDAHLGKGTQATQLTLAKAFHDVSKNAVIYNVVLPESRPSLNITLTIQEIYSHAAIPLPAQLPHAAQDGQSLIWQADLLGGLGLLYDIAEAKVRVKVPTPQVKSSTAPSTFQAAHSAGSATIVFSSNEHISASSNLHVGSVHFYQPTAIVAFRDLKRSIQVSHWSSSIAFEDTVELINNGPSLKGHFARIEHQKQAFARAGVATSPHVLSRLTMSLPPRIYSPYYYDTVGNVSWSNFRPSHDPAFPKAKAKKESVLEFRPRYPLLGGWTYNFTIGYSAPLHGYLRKDGIVHRLAVPFVTAIKDIPIDNARISISLPEGAKILSVEPPFAVDSMTEETLYSFLDTTGHPTLVFTKSAMSDMHNKDLLITYEYSTLATLQKPAAVAGAALIVFLTSVVLRRLDWNISPPSKALIKTL